MLTSSPATRSIRAEPLAQRVRVDVEGARGLDHGAPAGEVLLERVQQRAAPAAVVLDAAPPRPSSGGRAARARGRGRRGSGTRRAPRRRARRPRAAAPGRCARRRRPRASPRRPSPVPRPAVLTPSTTPSARATSSHAARTAAAVLARGEQDGGAQRLQPGVEVARVVRAVEARLQAGRHGLPVGRPAAPGTPWRKTCGRARLKPFGAARRTTGSGAPPSSASKRSLTRSRSVSRAISSARWSAIAACCGDRAQQVLVGLPDGRVRRPRGSTARRAARRTRRAAPRRPRRPRARATARRPSAAAGAVQQLERERAGAGPRHRRAGRVGGEQPQLPAAGVQAEQLAQAGAEHRPAARRGGDGDGVALGRRGQRLGRARERRQLVHAGARLGVQARVLDRAAEQRGGMAEEGRAPPRRTRAARRCGGRSRRPRRRCAPGTGTAAIDWKRSSCSSGKYAVARVLERAVADEGRVARARDPARHALADPHGSRPTRCSCTGDAARRTRRSASRR